jgi:hypothetical protein
MRLWTILVTAIWLAGCASQGTVDRDKLSELAVGRTTSAELASSWGPPLTEARMPDGRHLLTYRYVDMRTGPILSFVPGLGPVGSTVDTATGQVILTFDPRGLLLSYDMSGGG